MKKSLKKSSGRLLLLVSGRVPRWAPTSYEWSYNHYKRLYKWVTGVITTISGVITLLEKLFITLLKLEKEGTKARIEIQGKEEIP